MSNFNSVFRIQKAIVSISVISISSVQKVQQQKCSEICFEIKYFDEEFNLSKSNQFQNYDSDNINNKNSDNDDEKSDQKSNTNIMKSIHLVLLAALHQSDSLIYSEAIQNAYIDEIFSSEEVFATKEQLADLHMKDLVKSASYREVMNSQQHDY